MPHRSRVTRTSAPIAAARPRSLATRLAAGAIAFVLLLQPAAAYAVCLPTDLISGTPVAADAVPDAEVPDIDAAAGLLRLSDGRTLWARNADAERAMASTTKLMTALVVLESTRLDDKVMVSKKAAGVDWALGLQAGETATVRTLLEYLLVVSSNDAAIALAEHAAGSVPAFAARMNDKALELGLEESRFVTPHGLDTVGHHSSPSDLAVLIDTAMDEPEIRRIMALRAVTLPRHGKRPAKTVKATDELLGRYDGLLGGKTGFTDDAKYSFVACAERDGVQLTGVILGAKSNTVRFAQMRRLFDWGFKHVTLHRIGDASGTVDALPLDGHPSVTVTVRAAETTSVPVLDLDGPVTEEVSAAGRVSLPIFAGQQLGTIEVRQNGRTLLAVPAVASTSLASAEETVGRVPVSDYLDRSVLARAGTTKDPVARFDVNKPVHRRVDIDEKVKAPIEPGELLGHISYVQGSDLVVRVPIVAAEAVEAPGLLEAVGITFTRGWRAITGGQRMAALQLVS